MYKFIICLAVTSFVLAFGKTFPSEDYAYVERERIAYAKKSAWVGTFGTTVATNYVGIAETSVDTTNEPSVNADVWQLKKTVFDSDGLTILEQKTARGENGKLFEFAWTNRVDATYY